MPADCSSEARGLVHVSYFYHSIYNLYRGCGLFFVQRQFLESASFSAEPRGRNPYVLRAFWADREFRDGSEIRGIREKIAKGLVKRLLPASSARNAG